MADLKGYPRLPGDIALSRVMTEKGDDTVLYNTATRRRAYPNEATYAFAKRCRGDIPLEAIIGELSSLSGEPFETVAGDLSPLIEKMVDLNMLSFSTVPLPPRPGPVETALWKRLPSVQFEVTNQCNLHCKHCYGDSGRKREDELTTEEIKRVVDDLARAAVFNIVFTGGEPLLHPHFFEILQYARSKPMSCMVFTNGSMLTREVVQTFGDLGVGVVAVSLDGLEQTHDTFRGAKNWERAVQAIRLLKEAGIHVRVNVSLHKNATAEICEIMALLKEWGVDEYQTGPVSYTGRGGEEDFVITPGEYKEALQKIRAYEKSGGEPPKRLPYNPQLTNCGVGRSNLFIRSDGAVLPCPMFSDLIVGNVRHQSVADIWNTSGLLAQLRQMSALDCEKCRVCPHLKVCGGGCMADIYRRTGNLGYLDPFECAYFEVYSDYVAYIPEKLEKQLLSVEIR